MDIEAKVGIDQAKVDIFAELLQDTLRNSFGYKVIGRSDITSMLGLEAQKDMVGCEDDSCLAEIGGALGVDELVSGSLAKLGSYLVVSLKRIDPNNAKVIGQSTRKLKGDSDDNLIEAVAPMAAELYPEAAAANAHSTSTDSATAVSKSGDDSSVSARPKRSWSLGASLGSMNNLRDKDRGNAVAMAVWLQITPSFDIEAGLTLPFALPLSVRYWFWQPGNFRVGGVAHVAIFQRLVHGEDINTVDAAIGLGLVGEWLIDLPWGAGGIRLDIRGSQDMGLQRPTVPATLSAIWKL